MITHLERNHGCERQPKDRPSVELPEHATAYRYNECKADGREKDEHSEALSEEDPNEQADDDRYGAS